MTQSLKGIKANAIVSATSSITTSTSVGGNLLPTGNVTFDIGSSTARWKDLYLANNTIYLGNTAVSANSILPINLDIAPEVLTIQVAATDAGDDITWFWTWQTSTLPYARSAITNSPQTNVPLYKQGTYTINNFAANQLFGNMTQTHHGYFKWIDGYGTQNLVSWAVDNGNVNVTHPDINGGVSTSVQRYTVTVPSNLTIPTLTPPTVSYNVSFATAGAYTISGATEGNNKNIGPMYRGGTYTFNLDSSIAAHPFYLTTDNGTGFVSGSYIGEYTNGVTGSRNNGTTGKTTLVFTVPNNAPDTLYYQCGVHSMMRGAIVIKDLAVETNINGNYVIYFQHTHEGHKTPIEIRPIPSLVNQMCVVYDASVSKFVPQDLATYVENTPSFKNKIREVAGTATLVAPNGVAIVPTVLVVEDVSYLPLINNKNGDIAFDSYTDTMYVWETNAWKSTKPSSLSLSTANISITGGSTNQYLKTDGTGNLSWDSPSVTPKISSITYPGDDTAANPAGGQTITLTGSGFNSGASVLINGTYASVVAVVSSTSITFTSPAMAAGTYTLYVINTDGGTSISVPGISYSGTPVWSTSAGSLGTNYETTAISSSLAATGDNPITYSLYSGTLPPGSSLNSSTGLISGTSQATVSSTTYNFTIRATDAQNQDTDRAFSLTINPDAVSWSTPADNSTTTAYEYTTITPVTLSATSAAGKSITYTANSLPTGITLSGSSISGTPTTVGSTSTLLTGTATTTNKTATRTVNFVVNQDVVTWSSPADNTTTSAYKDQVMANVTMSATSAAGKSITYTANALPTGLSISGANITGTPTVAANSSSLITATASTTNRTATRTFNWVISVANDTYWKNTTLLLNGETTNTSFISDGSTNSFGLTINGDTKPVLFNPYQGDGYYSNYFNGSSSDIVSASTTAFNLGANPFCIEMWFYWTGGASNGYSGLCGSQTDYKIALSIWNSKIMYGASSNGSSWNILGAESSVGSTTLVAGQWYHIAYCRTGNTFSAYINGVRDITVSSSASIISRTEGFTVGGWYSTLYYFSGYISNFRFVVGSNPYDATQSTITVPTSPLTAIANTAFLTCQSNRFIDNSTNAFAITVNGSPTISPNIPFTANSSYSTYGSTYFDGSGDYLTIPYIKNSFDWWTSDCTIEAWVYPTTFTGWSYTEASDIHPTLIGNRAYNSTSDYWSFGLGSTGTVRFYYYNGSPITLGSSETVTLNQWNHIAMTKTSSGIKLFVNGVGNTVTAVSGTPLSGTENPLTIGSGNSNYINGYVSNLRIVKGTAVYTSNFTLPASPLTAITNTSLLTLQYNGGANNSGIIDNSNFNNIITRSGNSSQGSFSPYSQTGWSTYFNGTSNWLAIPTSTNTTLGTGNFTIEVWLYALASSGVIVEQAVIDEGGGNNTGWVLSLGASGVQFGNASGTTYIAAGLPSGVASLVNRWAHVALVRTSTTNISIYVDGQLHASTSTNVDMSMAIGQRSDTPTLLGVHELQLAGSYYNGYMSNFRIVKGTALYTTTFTPSTTPLTAITGTGVLTCQSNRHIDNSGSALSVGPTFSSYTGGSPTINAFGPFGSIGEATPLSYSNYFDGTGDYLSLASTTALNIEAGDFTIEAWINMKVMPTGTSTTGWGGDWNSWFIIYERSAGGTTGWQFRVGATLLTLGGDGDQSICWGTHGMSAGTWYHVAVTRQSGTYKLFVNGTSLSLTTQAVSMATSGAYYIGSEDTSGAYFNGHISNLRVIKGTAVYTSAFTPPTSPLTAISGTSLLTCQSTTIKDNSSNTLTITVNGDTKPRTFNPFEYTAQTIQSYTPSIHGGSCYFDGTGDYLSVPTSTNLDFSSGDFTVEAWVYPNALSSDSFIISASGSGGFFLGYSSSGTIGWGWGRNAVAWDYRVAGNGSTNTWQHVAVTRSGSSMKLFVNGTQSGTTQTLSTSYNLGTTSTTIGSQGANYYLNGYISDVRVIKGVALYTSNFVPPTQTLTNYSTTYPSSLLLNFNNAGIVDQHGTNVLETVGNAQLSTSVKKYGSASIYLTGGSNGYLKTLAGNLADYRTGDFTVESWVYFNNVSGIQKIFDNYNGNNNRNMSLCISNPNANKVQWYCGQTLIVESSSTVSTGQWYHIAVSRSSGTTRMFINGTSVGSASDSNDYVIGNSFVGIGGEVYTNNYAVNGYIDDLRITKGYARYTANFTAPTSALIAK